MMNYKRIDFVSNKVKMPSIDIGIVYLEYVKRGYACNTDYHLHNIWQAEFILKGENIICQFPDQSVIIDESKILIIPPGVYHQFTYGEGEVEYYSVKFSCADEKGILIPLLYDNPDNVIPVRNYLASILSNNSDTESIAVHMQNLLKILLELNLISGRALLEKNISEQIEDYLSSCPVPYPNAEQISEEMNLSRPYLSKKVKEETGLSLKPFIDTQRIKTAKTLLRFSDLTISEIAYQLNFPDVFSFSKFFKRLAECSPKNYRTRYQNKKDY